MAVDLWAWTEEDTILYLGIILAAGGILSGFCFGLIGPLSKRFDERILMIVCGICVMILGRAVMVAFPGDGDPLFIGNYTECGYPEPGAPTADPAVWLKQSQEVGIEPLAKVGEPGCAYCWCLEQPKMTVVQFIVGMGFSMAGYPFCTAIIASLFSKVLGDIPQVSRTSPKADKNGHYPITCFPGLLDGFADDIWKHCQSGGTNLLYLHL